VEELGDERTFWEGRMRKWCRLAVIKATIMEGVCELLRRIY
jgi:hypothetical protein